MAEAEAGEKEEKPEKKSGGSSKMVKILLWAAVALAFVATAVGIAYFVAKQVKMGDVETEETIQKEETKIAAPPMAVPMQKYTMILMDESGRTYTMRLGLSITIASEREDKILVSQEITDRKDQLNDVINEVLLGVDPRSFSGNAQRRQQALNDLRSVITRAINARMKNKIDNILITEFIFQ